MNLAERLYSQRLTDISAAFGKSQRVFKINGNSVYGYVELIECVMERMARRFGRIPRESAFAMHERLANKYCAYPGKTIGALDRRNHTACLCNCPYLYPQADVRKHILEAIEARDKVAEAERECIAQRRKFIGVKYRNNAMQTPIKRKKGQAIAQWRADERNLQECRKLIQQIKGVIREGS